MPGYNTHITWSSIAGVGVGCVAKLFYGVSFPQAIFGGVLCTLGGVLPDVDSDSSRAFQRCMTTISGTSALMIASRLRDFTLEPEAVVMISAGVYFFITYIVGGFVKKMTVHRGMCHSIPFGIIVSEIIFILSSGSTQMRLFKAGAILLGILIHLTLDEFYSIDVLSTSSSRSSGSSRNYSYSNSRRRKNNYYDDYDDPYDSGRRRNKRGGNFRLIRVKSSFGTALKLIDYKHMSSTIAFYVIAAILGHFTMSVQSVLAQMGDVNQAQFRGKVAVDRVRKLYPSQFELSIIQWVAENDLVLLPGKKDNPKWTELKDTFAIGKDASARRRRHGRRGTWGKMQNSSDPSYVKSASNTNGTEEDVSLLDVVNWNSVNGSDEVAVETGANSRPTRKTGSRERKENVSQ